MYRDKDRKQINKQQWQDLQEQEHYCIVEVYQQGDIQIALRWNGVDKSGEEYRDADMFKISIFVKSDERGITFADESQLLMPPGKRKSYPLLALATQAFNDDVYQYCRKGMEPFDGFPSHEVPAPDQSLNEYVEPEAWRLERIADDPDAPDLDKYGDAMSMYA